MSRVHGRENESRKILNERHNPRLEKLEILVKAWMLVTVIPA